MIVTLVGKDEALKVPPRGFIVGVGSVVAVVPGPVPVLGPVPVPGPVPVLGPVPVPAVVPEGRSIVGSKLFP